MVTNNYGGLSVPSSLFSNLVSASFFYYFWFRRVFKLISVQTTFYLDSTMILVDLQSHSGKRFFRGVLQYV